MNDKVSTCAAAKKEQDAFLGELMSAKSRVAKTQKLFEKVK